MLSVNIFAKGSLGGDFIAGCTKSCTDDGLEILDINFFSLKLKCKCYCDSLMHIIDPNELSDHELQEYRRKGTFSKPLQDKQKRAYKHCFDGVKLKR